MHGTRRQALRGLIAKLHRLQRAPQVERLLALQIQEELLDRNRRAERRVRLSRAKVSALKDRLKARGHDREMVRSVRAQIATIEAQADNARRWIETLRSLGDSIAYIHADRFDLKPLAFRPSPGFLTGKRGARLERKMVRAVFEMGAVAVLNDLTHTLRHGDLTVFRPDGKFMLIEAKSGRGGQRARTERQLAAARGVTGYLESDERHDASGAWYRIDAPAQVSDHGPRAAQMAARLASGGWVHEEVEHGLHYVLIDCAVEETGIAEAFTPLAGRRLMGIPVNQIKRERLGYTPFALTLGDADVAARFYAGDFVMNVFVDLDVVTASLADRGFAMEVTDDPNHPWRIVKLGPPEGSMEGTSYVSFHLIGRLGAEFVTLGWLLATIAAHIPKHLIERLGAAAAKRG